MKEHFKKIILVCLCLTTFQMQTVFAAGQMISLNINKGTMSEVFKEIEKQSDYKFFYNNEQINLDVPINVNVKENSIDNVLSQIFSGTNITYKIINNHIVLTNKSHEQKTSTLSAIAQQGKSVQGKVIDFQGEPLIGVNVVVKGTTLGSITDIDGNFQIEDVPDNAVLVFSYIGYLSQEIAVSGRSSVNITLQEDTQKLDEVVVVGYGIQKKVNLTGAVEQIDNKTLENRPVSGISKALQGTMGNLNLSIDGDGGRPGSSMSYNVRGTTSLSGGAPLIIVDGIPADDLNHINPNDVATITVLKDAAASAIYGARAAYGVILVTTKTAGLNEKFSISYSNLFGFNNPTVVPNQVNSLDFANAYNIASTNSGLSPMFSNEHIQRIKDYMDDPINTPSNIVDPNNSNLWSYATLDNDNVDWYRAFFKSSSANQKHDINIRGGGNTVSYYVGAGYYDEGGFLRYADEKFKRHNIVSNLHIEPLKWLRADFKVRFNKSKKNYLTTEYDGDIGNWIHLATTRQPNWALKDPNGNWAATSHIYKQIEGGRQIIYDNILNMIGAIEAEPIKGWKINMDYSFRNKGYESTNHGKTVPWEYTVSGEPIMTNHNSYAAEKSNNEYQSFNVYTSFGKYLSGHYFYGLIGQQVEQNKYSYLFGRRRDLITHDIPSLPTATGDQSNTESKTHWANVGTFFRVNYNYMEKYLVEFNARYDGTSKFPKGDQFGFFPSVSLGYNISKEDFWKSQDHITQLKLRGSYGALGNQDVANYLHLSTVGIGSKYGYILDGILPNYLNAPGLVSRTLTWETAYTLNFGIDAGFLSNRLLLNFDWYRRTTKDMFGPAEALPAVLGANVPQENNANLQTTGFELSLTWREELANGLKYNVGAVLSDYTSKVTKYNNPTKILSTYYEGQKIGEIWGYRTQGIIQTEEQLKNMPDQSIFYGTWSKGDIEYADLNGDKIIDYGKNTKDDHGDKTIIGNTTPRYSFGITLGAAWQGVDVSMFFQGVGKRDFAPIGGNNSGVFFWGFTGGFGANMYKETSDFWTENNTGAYYPKPYTTGEVGKNQQTQTRYLQDASYMRLKNLSIGYTIPKKLTDKIQLNRIRFYISGENLFTVTSLHKNFDPELLNGDWGAGKMYPLSKTISFGLNVDF